MSEDGRDIRSPTTRNTGGYEMLHKVLNVTGNMVAMPKHFLVDNKLSLSAKGLLAVLFALDEPVELEEFAEMFGEKKEMVESCMKEIIEAGYLGDVLVTVEDVKNE